MMRGLLRGGLALGLSGAAFIAYWARYGSFAGFSPLEALILLTVTIWLCFLIGLALALTASIDESGSLSAPKSLSCLITWLVLIPSSGLAIGSWVNYADTKSIVLATASAPGAKVTLGDKRWLHIHGPIGTATVRSLQDISPRYGIKFLSLDSPGGSIDAARELVRLIEEAELTVIVTGFCDSACVPVALAGQPLRVAPDASFGFHRGSAFARPESQTGYFIGTTGTELLLSDLRARGVPAWLLVQAENTPPNQMYRINGEKMIELGLANPLEQ